MHITGLVALLPKGRPSDERSAGEPTWAVSFPATTPAPPVSSPPPAPDSKFPPGARGESARSPRPASGLDRTLLTTQPSGLTAATLTSLASLRVAAEAGPALNRVTTPTAIASRPPVRRL